MNYYSIFFLFVVFYSSLLGQNNFGKISLPLGKVDVYDESGSWERAKPNQPVSVGNLIRTGKRSRCEITLTGGGKIRIGENSELELNNATLIVTGNVHAQLDPCG